MKLLITQNRDLVRETLQNINKATISVYKGSSQDMALDSLLKILKERVTQGLNKSS